MSSRAAGQSLALRADTKGVLAEREGLDCQHSRQEDRHWRTHEADDGE